MTTVPHDPSKPWTYDECLIRGPAGETLRRQPPEPDRLPNCTTCAVELTAREVDDYGDTCGACWNARYCRCGNEYIAEGRSVAYPALCLQCVERLLGAKAVLRQYVDLVLKSNQISLIEHNIKTMSLPF